MIPDRATMEQWREEAAAVTDPYERRDFLASKLERLERGYGRGQFNMRRITHDCVSPSCVEGWARYFWGIRSDSLHDWLGFSVAESDEIFRGVNPITRRYFSTPQTAAKILREAPRPPLGGGEEKP